MKKSVLLVCCVLFLPACSQQAVQVKSPVAETRQDQIEALQDVVGAVSGQPVSEQELRDLVREVRRDEDARSAVEAVSSAMSGQALDVKYCPVTGKRYSSRLTVCPVHKVPLRSLTQEGDPDVPDLRE